MKEKDIIKARDLDFFYGRTQALRHVTAAIPAGRVTALIGPSGCGKSTFLRTLNRMSDLVEGTRVEGSLTFHGEEVFSPNVDVTELRRRVGMVFQKPNPFPMSIYDNVAYGPRTHGRWNRAALDDIVERSLRAAAIWDEVKDCLKKDALGLSGGQQQRVCSALDPISTARIEDLILELREHYTIVMVTHNMQQALRVSDKTAFFLLGELVEIGDTETLFSMPRDKRTEDYITGRFG